MRRSRFLIKKGVGWFVGGARTPMGLAFRKGTALKFRATAISAGAGANLVQVSFTESPVATNYATGVAITVNGGARTITNAVPDKSVVDYTIDGAALADGDVVVWTYTESVGDYQNGAGDPLGDQTLNFTLPLPPPSGNAIQWESGAEIALESGTGSWEWG